MNIWHAMPQERITAMRFPVYITITKGSNKTYTFDPDTDCLQLIQMLYSAACYPVNGGIIPGTMDKSGKPVEVLVICQEPLELQTLVECSPAGVIKVGEQEGIREKIVALPILENTNNLGFVEEKKVLESVYEDVRYFFNIYNGPEENEVWTNGGLHEIKAVDLIEEAMQRYHKKFRTQQIE